MLPSYLPWLRSNSSESIRSWCTLRSQVQKKQIDSSFQDYFSMCRIQFGVACWIPKSVSYIPPILMPNQTWLDSAPNRPTWPEWHNVVGGVSQCLCSTAAWIHGCHKKMFSVTQSDQKNTHTNTTQQHHHHHHHHHHIFFSSTSSMSPSPITNVIFINIMLTRSEKEHEEDEVDEAKENTEDKEEESERMLMIMSMISDNYDGVQTVQWKTECPNVLMACLWGQAESPVCSYCDNAKHQCFHRYWYDRGCNQQIWEVKQLTMEVQKWPHPILVWFFSVSKVGSIQLFAQQVHSSGAKCENIAFPKKLHSPQNIGVPNVSARHHKTTFFANTVIMVVALSNSGVGRFRAPVIYSERFVGSCWWHFCAPCLDLVYIYIYLFIYWSIYLLVDLFIYAFMYLFTYLSI